VFGGELMYLRYVCDRDVIRQDIYKKDHVDPARMQEKTGYGETHKWDGDTGEEWTLV
jgi:hypothetical protein